MAIVTGTFSGTGTSAPVAICHGIARLVFAGTASVDLEEQVPEDGTWIKITTGIVATFSQNFDSPVIRTIRFNCTAHTNNVVYRIETN